MNRKLGRRSVRMATSLAALAAAVAMTTAATGPQAFAAGSHASASASSSVQLPTPTAVLADKYVKDKTPPPRRVWRRVELSVPKGSDVKGFCYVLNGTIGVTQVGTPCDNSWVAVPSSGTAFVWVRPLLMPSNDLSVVAVAADGSRSNQADLSIPTFWGGIDKLGDITGDGKIDLMSRLGTQMRFNSGLGNGRVGATYLSKVDTGAQASLYARVGSVDGGGNNGLLTIYNGVMAKLAGDGIGDFGSEGCCLYSPIGQSWSDVTQLVGAMNVSGSGSHGVVVVRSGLIQFYPIYGATYLFVGQPTTLGNADKGTQLVGVQDFNGDGKVDVLVREGYTLRLYAGLGNGTFKAPVTFAKGLDINKLADITSDGDANGDNKADLWATTTRGGLEFVPGLGAKGFGKPVPIARTGWAGVELY